MMRHQVFIVTLLAILLLPVLTFAQEPIIYPSEGQSQEQQEKDEFECYKWARQDTGIDPANPAASTPEPPPSEKKRDGSILRGAARSAAMGAVAGSIVGNSDDAKTGAQLGAATGGLSATFRKRDAQRQEETRIAQQAEAAQAATLETYYRAFSACMTGRGYTVK